MKNFIKILSLVLIVLMISISFLACNKAENVQKNISKASDSFETYRKATIINLRTDKVLMQIEGYISIKNSATDELAIIIMTAPNQYEMHYIYLGGEIIYLVEQSTPSVTDPYHWDIRIFAEFPNIIVE